MISCLSHKAQAGWILRLSVVEGGPLIFSLSQKHKSIKMNYSERLTIFAYRKSQVKLLPALLLQTPVFLQNGFRIRVKKGVHPRANGSLTP